MRYQALVLTLSFTLTPQLATGGPPADHGGWTNQQQQWLQQKSTKAFRALMKDLEADSPLPNSKKKELVTRLNSWPADHRVAPDSWTDQLMNGEAPALIDCARVLSFEGRDIDDQRLKQLLNNKSLRALLDSGAVHRVKFSNNPIGDPGAKALATSGLLDEIDHLHLAQTDVNSDGIDALMTSVPDGCDRIEGLNLARWCDRQVKNNTIIGKADLDNRDVDLSDALSKGADETHMDEAFSNADEETASNGTDEPARGSDEAKTTGQTQRTDDGQPNISITRDIQSAGTGTLPPSTIHQHIQRQAIDGIRACYNRLLQENPDSAGKVIVTFKIHADGHTSNARSIGQHVGGDVGTCVANTLSDVTFPSPDGGSMMVRQTFELGTVPENPTDADASGE